jgi:cytochrome b
MDGKSEEGGKPTLALDILAKYFISTEVAGQILLRVEHGGIGGARFVGYAREFAVILFYVRKLVVKDLNTSQ